MIHGTPRSTFPYIIGCFFPSPHPHFLSCNLAKVSWRKWYHYTTRFMRDSLPFASLFTEYIDSHQGAALVPGGLQSRSPSIGCHREHEPSSLSPVTGANWEPNTGCIQFKPQSLSLAICYHTGKDNLGCWHWKSDQTMTSQHKIWHHGLRGWEPAKSDL